MLMSHLMCHFTGIVYDATRSSFSFIRLYFRALIMNAHFLLIPRFMSHVLKVKYEENTTHFTQTKTFLLASDIFSNFTRHCFSSSRSLLSFLSCVIELFLEIKLMFLIEVVEAPRF